MGFQATSLLPYKLDNVLLTPTTVSTAADKAALDALFKDRNTIIQWFKDVPGNGKIEDLKKFLARWPAYSLNLGASIPKTTVDAASKLDATTPKSVNAYIYQAIGTLNATLIPSTLPKPTTPKPTSGIDDPDSQFINPETQRKAVDYLLSSIGWRNSKDGGKIQNGLQLHYGNTLVDWPATLDVPVNPKPTTGVTYGSANYYRLSCAEIASWLTALYRKQGPSAMYTAIQLLQFVPKAAAGSPQAAIVTIPDALLVAGGKAQIVALYPDPAKPDDKPDSKTLNVWYLRTLDDWAKLALAAYVLQGIS